MAFKEWSTTYTGASPVQDPDPITSVQPDVEDDPTAIPRLPGTGDNTRVSQIKTLRDKVQTIAKRLGDSANNPIGSVVAQVATLETSDTHTIHDNIDGEIAGLGDEKTNVIATDWLLGEDSEASNAKVKIQVGNLPGGSGTDANAIHKTTAAEISALAAEKVTPIAGDWLIGEDSAASNAKVKIQVGNLPSTVPLSAAGDLLTHSGSSLARVPRPSEDNLMLLSDSTMPLKMRWGTLPAHSETHEPIAYPYLCRQRYYGPIIQTWTETRLGEAALRVYGNNAIMVGRYYAYVTTYNETTKEWSPGIVHTLEPSVSGYNADGDIFENTIVLGRTTGRFFSFIYTEGLGWNEEQQIISDPYSASFGYSIAINEWGCVVSDWWKNTSYAVQGAVYVYRRDPVTFVLKQTILPDSPDVYFGTKVKLDGTQLAITARSSTSEIVLYIYELSGTTWVKKDRIVFTGSVYENYKTGLAIKGSQCLVATPRAATADAVTSLVRRDGSWSINDEILNPEPTSGTVFGSDIALVDGRCIIGKQDGYNYHDPPELKGCAYYYKFDGSKWVFIYKFTPPDADVKIVFSNPNPVYGYRVAFNGTTAMISGPYWDFEYPDRDHNRGFVDLIEFYGDPLDSIINSDAHAFHDNTEAEILGVTEKVTLVAEDIILGEDSANLYSKVKIKIGNLITVAELERATTGAETPGATVSFDLAGVAPSGQGLANTPSGYRILVFREGVKMTYAASPSTNMHYYYDAVNNEIDILATGTADAYQIVFF